MIEATSPTSWVVGDMTSDVELAGRARCAGGLLVSATATGPNVVGDLLEAASHILLNRSVRN